MAEATWQVRPRATAQALDRLDLDSPLLAQLLLNRGVATPTDAARFLDPEGDELHDPSALADMPAALERIVTAAQRGERIVVYGDYDVDGLSGATLLALALREVGARVEVFIPHRERDGYGLNGAVLAQLAQVGAGLVVSVDCGISAAAEIDAAARAGLEVIVTDHHQVPPDLPRAVAVLNPHRADCQYPFKPLAGAGVALKLAQALARRCLPAAQVGPLEARLLELATLGTVADVMPLVGENRAIVRRGLRRLNTSPSPGLLALSRLARLEPGWIDAEAIAFKLAPRLNAAGRMADAALAQRLLSANQAAEATRLAEQLERLNAERRIVTEDALGQARAEVAAFGDRLPAGIVLSGAFPAGILGLIAARLAEEAGRPVAVLQRGDEVCRGSVRGARGFDTAAGVRACGDLLLTFGGHRAAAGLTLLPEHLAEFGARFARVAEPWLAALPPAGPVFADCRLRAESVNWKLTQMLAQLEPCGEGNPAPLFETSGLLVREAKVVGESHLRLRLASDTTRLRGIIFGGARGGPAEGQIVDLLHRVRGSFWQDSVSVELDVVAWRPSGR